MINILPSKFNIMELLRIVSLISGFAIKLICVYYTINHYDIEDSIKIPLAVLSLSFMLSNNST